jgi:hypothetical protein
MRIIKENPTKWKLMVNSRPWEKDNPDIIHYGAREFEVRRGYDCCHNVVFEGTVVPEQGQYRTSGSLLKEADTNTYIRIRHLDLFKLLSAVADGTVKVDRKRKGFKGLFTFSNHSGRVSLTVYREKKKAKKPGKKTRVKNPNC